MCYVRAGSQESLTFQAKRRLYKVRSSMEKAIAVATRTRNPGWQIRKPPIFSREVRRDSTSFFLSSLAQLAHIPLRQDRMEPDSISMSDMHANGTTDVEAVLTTCISRVDVNLPEIACSGMPQCRIPRLVPVLLGTCIP